MQGFPSLQGDPEVLGGPAWQKSDVPSQVSLNVQALSSLQEVPDGAGCAPAQAPDPSHMEIWVQGFPSSHEVPDCAGDPPMQASDPLQASD